MAIGLLTAGVNAADESGSFGSDVADTVNALKNATIRPLKICLIGDSLTGSGTQPNIPVGVGTYLNAMPLTNLNSGASAFWIAQQALIGTANNIASTGVLKTDGAGNLAWNYNSEGFGAWVDVSSGGFFTVPSGGGVNNLCVKIVNARQNPSPVQDTISSFVAYSSMISDGGANLFSSFLQDELGLACSVRMWGITGDHAQGVATRWQQMLDYEGQVDAVGILIGTNNQPATAEAAIDLFNVVSNTIDEISARVKVVFVGGLFPRSDVSAGIQSNMQLYSKLLQKKCDDSSGNLVYWDAYSFLVDPATTTGALKATAYHTDNLHFVPYGAWLAKNALAEQIRLKFNILRNDYPRRGYVPYNEATGVGSLNLNPFYLGSGGTGSGSGGITGSVPNNCSAARSAGTQTMALSSVSGLSQNQLRIELAGSTTTSDYHDLIQSVTLPTVAGGWGGRMVYFELDMTVEAANLLNTFNVTLVSGASRKSDLFWNQDGRIWSNFSGSNTHRITFRSKPLFVDPSVTTFQIRLRMGCQSGGSATIKVARCEILEFRP